MRSEFSDLNIKVHHSPYSLKTCAGVAETGAEDQSFQVESLNGQIILPECNALPNDHPEIHTAEAALHYLLHIDPKLDPQVPLMILLGRGQGAQSLETD